MNAPVLSDKKFTARFYRTREKNSKRQMEGKLFKFNLINSSQQDSIVQEKKK
jgi:hypothetical protein